MKATGTRISGLMPDSPTIIASAMITIALSAIGSSIRPKALSCCQARASRPST
jgi:hypothetical protein